MLVYQRVILQETSIDLRFVSCANHVMLVDRRMGIVVWPCCEIISQSPQTHTLETRNNVFKGLTKAGMNPQKTSKFLSASNIFQFFKFFFFAKMTQNSTL